MKNLVLTVYLSFDKFLTLKHNRGKLDETLFI